MMSDALTAMDRENFVEQGWVVLKRAVPADAIGPALDHLNTLDQPARIDPDHPAVQACYGERIEAAIGELLGPDYRISHRFSDYHRRAYAPDADWRFQHIHVDDDYPTPMPNDWALASFVFLTDVKPGGGALIYCGRSHITNRQLMSHTLDALNGNIDLTDRSGVETEYLAEAGDAMLFHHLLGHCGTNNLTDPDSSREGLISRWYTDRRIVPGLKDFAEMPPIEKVNSARYLSHRYDSRFQFPALPEAGAAAALYTGFGPPGGIAAYTVLHWRGAARLLYAPAADPEVVVLCASSDLVHWRAERRLVFAQGPVTGLTHTQIDHDTYLCVSFERGEPKTLILRSTDLEEWTPVLTLDRRRAAQLLLGEPEESSAIAWGRILYGLSADGTRLTCNWSGDGVDSRRHGPRDVLPPGAAPAAAGVLLGPVRCGDTFALILDPVDRGAPPHVALSEDCAVFDAPLQPLGHDEPAPPRCIRPLARAQAYWLVTYLGQREREDRLFLGVIDWTEPSLRLRRLADRDALLTAFETVGFV